MRAKYLIPVVLTVALITVAGCGPKDQTQASDEAKNTPAAPLAQAREIDPATVSTIKGKVLFEGTAPESAKIPIRGNPECAALHPDGSVASEELLVSDGNLQNVFVYVKEGVESYRFETPTQAVNVENKNCVYVPHVVGVQTNQPVNLINSDQTLHNVHSYSKNNKSWNLGLPFQGMKQTKKFSEPEMVVTLKCDVHPWMKGYIGVLNHPFFAVTGTDGSFELNGLPAGEYLIEAWHEKLGAQSQKIRIEPQETKQIEFKFSA